MKVLVATADSQGVRKNDFCNATVGELVTFCNECDGEEVDGRCGCRRSMAGLESHKATTTFQVVNRDITREDFEQKLRDSLVDAGWAGLMSQEELEAQIKEDADELLRLAEYFPLGRILEKRGRNIQTRKVKPGKAK